MHGMSQVLIFAREKKGHEQFEESGYFLATKKKMHFLVLLKKLYLCNGELRTVVYGVPVL